VNSKASVSLILVVVLMFGAARTLWALYGNYNRPEPLMDYVPQEIGMYDTSYQELDEFDCRGCHGNSMSDRHHMLDPVVRLKTCDPCHEVIDEPPFVIVVRDCLTCGCHSPGDAYTGRWHHNTDLSASGQCVACHDPNLIAEISPLLDLETYPPSIVTPTPYSCENCHWGQAHSATGDPDNPGHPSTYDHYGASGGFVGFHEYSKPIYGNFDTHHMDFEGNVARQCYDCHALDPTQPEWDPANPKLIRYCERCHSAESLHGIGPHVQEDTSGWEAVGFHVDGDPDRMDLDPTVYRTSDPTGPYDPETTDPPDGFTAGEKCIACHGEDLPAPPRPPGKKPVIDNTTEGIVPKHGACGCIVTLTGKHFGQQSVVGYEVQMKAKDSESRWIDMPIQSWTKMRIEFKVPCWDFAPGNYKVRVVTPTGKSNRVNFTLTGWNTVRCISPHAGPCDEWITFSGVGLGNKRSEMSADGYNGVHRFVDFVSSQGTYTALKYKDWADTSVKTQLHSVFEDTMDAHTGHRNFVQDDGNSGCAEEPTMMGCDELAYGTYSVYVKAVYFGDEDASGGLSCGDTIYQVVVSDPMHFDLIEGPGNGDGNGAPTPSCSIRLQLKRSGGDGCCFISTALEPTLRPMFRP
jgi:hypothetical protein